VLLVAGVAQRFHVSAAIGAFLFGIALSGSVARGEFSIVIAGLGVAIEPRLGPLSAAYVLLMAVLGPFLARLVR